MVDLNDEWTGRKQDGSGRSFVRPSVHSVRSLVRRSDRIGVAGDVS